MTLSVPCRPMPMVSSVDQVAAYKRVYAVLTICCMGTALM